MAGQVNDQTIRSTGFTEVFKPDQPFLDIVFIHGFKGHPERTWTYKGGGIRHRNGHDGDMHGELGAKRRKLNFIPRPSTAGVPVPAVFWPRDLIPCVLPNARVLTYGYDTKIKGPFEPSASNLSVYEIAWNFLVALEAERRSESSRPLLFVAHSLGGIIVKEMLRRSSDTRLAQAHLTKVFASTIGTIFFGTPHAGADPRGLLLKVAEKVCKAAGFTVNQQVIDSLLPSSERLRELREAFGNIAQEGNMIIHSFQEQYPLESIRRKVVEDGSSCLNMPAIEITEHIGNDHIGMSKFTGPNDPEFKKVAAALQRIASIIPQRSLVQFKPLTSGQYEILISSLRFEQIDARYATIRKAHAKTCKWLLRQSEWIRWLDPLHTNEHHGLLWIKGKPGAGKSTLIKFAFDYLHKNKKDKVIINFFFNARGEELERTTLGMYQSLLLQLIEQRPELQAVLGSHPMASKLSQDHRWTVESLKSLLEHAIIGLDQSSIVCFIDALDECNESEVRDMLRFLQQLGDSVMACGVDLHVCFSSRHYPHITVEHGLELTLEGQEGHSEDITNYINSTLLIGHSKIAQQIRDQVQEKASGVFMWVILVVDMLNKEFDNGEIYKLQRRLHELPRDLHDLFRDILSRDCHNTEKLLLCMQWIMYARTPLKPEQLYWGIISGTTPEDLKAWDPNELSLEDINRYILNSSKGLADVTNSKAATVQFIHESVRDFLVKENGLASIFPQLHENFLGQSHDRLGQCCMNYISLNVYELLEIHDPLPDASSSQGKKLRQSAASSFPFLEYTVRNIFYHLEMAGGPGISQKVSIDNFPLETWINVNNLIQQYNSRRYEPHTTLLYILAEHDISKLISSSSIPLCLNLDKRRYGMPIIAALATGSYTTLRIFCEGLVASLPVTNREKEEWKHMIEAKKDWAKIGRGFKFSRREDPLQGLCLALGGAGEQFLLSLILRSQQFLELERRVETPIDWAAKANFAETVYVLLKTSGNAPEFGSIACANPELLSAAMKLHMHQQIQDILQESVTTQGSFATAWGSVLSIAAEQGHEFIARLILDSGRAKADLRDDSGKEPLQFAAKNGHESIVQLLLETGQVNPDTKDAEQRTPLQYAARGGHESIVQLLLKTGQVNPDTKDAEQRTPLQYAARGGYDSVVRLLLATGQVNPDIQDEWQGTPLQYAAVNGHESIVQLLLKTGQVNPDTKDAEQRTPLQYAARGGHDSVVRLLLETGQVNPDIQDKWQETPLHYAARYGHDSVIRLLLATGQVNPDTQDYMQRTPLRDAARGGYDSVVRLLLATGQVNPDIQDKWQETPLHCAARGGHDSVIRLLLATGQVNPNIQDKDQQTPLQKAAAHGHRSTIRLLRQYLPS